MVDNCSKDRSVEMLESKYPDVILVKNDVNNLFAKANNQRRKNCQRRISIAFE